MRLSVDIPDDLVASMNVAHRNAEPAADLSRRALEALALEEYKANRLTEAQLRRLLGFSTRYQLDGFLMAHGVTANVTMEDLRRDLQDLESLGL